MSELHRILKMAGLQDLVNEVDSATAPVEKTASTNGEVMDTIKSMNSALDKLAQEMAEVAPPVDAAAAPEAVAAPEDKAALIASLEALVAEGKATPEEMALLEELKKTASRNLDAALDKVAATKFWSDLEQKVARDSQQVKVAGITEDSLDKIAANLFWQNLAVKVASHVTYEQKRQEDLAVLNKIASEYPALFAYMMKQSNEQLAQESVAIQSGITGQKRMEEIQGVTKEITEDCKQGDDKDMEEHLAEIGQKLSSLQNQLRNLRK